jgi:hypothetical protein
MVARVLNSGALSHLLGCSRRSPHVSGAGILSRGRAVQLARCGAGAMLPALVGVLRRRPIPSLFHPTYSSSLVRHCAGRGCGPGRMPAMSGKGRQGAFLSLTPKVTLMLRTVCDIRAIPVGILRHSPRRRGKDPCPAQGLTSSFRVSS